MPHLNGLCFEIPQLIEIRLAAIASWDIKQSKRCKYGLTGCAGTPRIMAPSFMRDLNAQRVNHCRYGRSTVSSIKKLCF